VDGIVHDALLNSNRLASERGVTGGGSASDRCRFATDSTAERVMADWENAVRSNSLRIDATWSE
jgi:hypothetical protein